MWVHLTYALNWKISIEIAKNIPKHSQQKWLSIGLTEWTVTWKHQIYWTYFKVSSYFNIIFQQFSAIILIDMFVDPLQTGALLKTAHAGQKLVCEYWKIFQWLINSRISGLNTRMSAIAVWHFVKLLDKNGLQLRLTDSSWIDLIWI